VSKGARQAKGSIMVGERIFSGFPKEEEVGYARAAVVDGWVFVSGTTGFDPETKQFPPDVESQCENCFRNIERALKEAGASLADLVRVLVVVVREEDFPKLMPIIRKHCYAARPANTAIFARLVSPQMLVEIEVTAKIPR
jgi:enamine deaminase RidA (YjgF/YER057c/UK114 family)